MFLSVTKICGRPLGQGESESSELKATAPWVIIRQCHLPTHPRRAAKTSNSPDIVQQVQHNVQNLLAYITGPEAQSQTADTVELTLFRRLLALGAALLRLFVVTRAAVRPVGPVLAPDGMPLRSHEQRSTTYDSVFGKVRFGRHYFTAPGQEGICPLEAELSLSARCDSDLLCEWVAYGTTDVS